MLLLKFQHTICFLGAMTCLSEVIAHRTGIAFLHFGDCDGILMHSFWGLLFIMMAASYHHSIKTYKELG